MSINRDKNLMDGVKISLFTEVELLRKKNQQNRDRHCYTCTIII